MLWQDRHQPPSLHKEKFYNKSAQPQDTNYIFSLKFHQNKSLDGQPFKNPQIRVLVKAFLGLSSSKWREA